MREFLTTDQKTALGSLVFRAGELEHTIDWMFAALLRIDIGLYKKLAEDRMLGWKLDAFKAYGLTKLRTKRDRQRFAEIMDELKGLNGERTIAVHGEWLPGGTGVTLAELFRLGPFRPAVAKHNRRGSAKVSELKAERLEAIAGRLDHSTGALAHFFMDRLIRPRARSALRRASSRERSAPHGDEQ